MTDLIDRADSGELPVRGTLTTNLAAYRLRESQIYTAQRLTAADTMTIRTDLTADPHLTGEALILADPNVSGEIVPLSHMLQEPPTGPVPPLPPLPPPAPKWLVNGHGPADYRGRRRNPVREPLPLWTHAAAYVGTLLLGVMGGASLMFVVLSASGHVW